ncbi:helix-turn-helix domain-containing protein [Blastomonas sp. CCH2-E1]|jgi:excisionase family DNA binding protein|uniref:helix-turn-helix domain-containing protein n=1 Tax=Blastomonas sp. CCH2-E1 TaxID=1768740 RepID=UPI000824ABAE|nr:helix-turn-helix domain-containing protein [Blastomonas sp. CCH2-E1]
MTLPASALPFGNRLPSADDRQIANQLRQILAAHKAGEAHLQVSDPATKKPVDITLTPAMSDLFLELLRYIGSGDAVTLLPIQQMLTTQQAADLLNVSRPFLIKLIEKGDIPHSMVGRHRRLKAEDVFAYKSARDKARAEALDELIADSADLY